MKENLKAGTVLQERYVLEKVIGRGGFGVTYRARDLRVDVPVAVKEYLSQWELSEKEALRETRLAAKFYDLEGIAAARDCFVENGHIFIVLEYVKGTSIKQHLKKKGRMDGKQTLEKMKPIIKSVGKIHEEGVIHRDISADNIMITEDGRLILVDFGTARFMKEEPGKPFTLIFKRGFAPVEQCRVHGEQGPWTDIYSLCATIYYMITGMIPEDAVERMIDDRLKPLEKIQGTGLTKKQAACIMKGLAVQPENRYANIGEFVEDLYGEGEEKDGEAGDDTETINLTSSTGYSTTSLIREFQEMECETGKRHGKKWIVLAGVFAVAVGVFGVWNRLAVRSTITESPSKPETKITATPQAVSTSEPTPTAQPSDVPLKRYSIGNYKGMTKKQVLEKTKELRKAGLSITYKEQYSDKEKGQVITQKPAAGKKYEKIQSVVLVLTLSKGTKPTPKPATRTETKKQANSKKEKKPEVDFSGSLDEIP